MRHRSLVTGIVVSLVAMLSPAPSAVAADSASASATAKSVPGAAMPTQAGSTPMTPAKAAPELTPQAHALEIAGKLGFAKRAMHEVRHAAAELKDGPLRAAVEAQLQAPWLPPEAFAYGHHAEAESMLHAAGLLAPESLLALPPTGVGSFAAAPGGPCEGGHHGYPGGLAVHEWANLAHARALAKVYESVYGVALNDEWLTAAALWHDTMKAATLPWDASGDCPHREPQLAGTALHHPLGVAAAILRHLPAPLILVIAAAHAPPTKERIGEVCNSLRAAGIIAVGNEQAIPCPPVEPTSPRLPIEAFVNNSADSDYAITGAAWSWYASQTPGGWERFAALAQDGSDLAAWQRGERK